MTVKKDLDQLKKDAVEANHIVTELEESENIHTISNVNKFGQKDGNKNQETDLITKNLEPDEKSSHTTFNAWDSKDPSTGGKRHPRVALIHELKHAFDRDQGKLSDAKNKDGIDVDEVNAVKVENKVRKKTGDPQRTTFGGVEISKEDLNDKKK
jgi:hypothetical protein